MQTSLPHIPVTTSTCFPHESVEDHTIDSAETNTDLYVRDRMLLYLTARLSAHHWEGTPFSSRPLCLGSNVMIVYMGILIHTMRREII